MIWQIHCCRSANGSQAGAHWQRRGLGPLVQDAAHEPIGVMQ